MITLEEALKNLITCADAYKCTKAERAALDESVNMIANVVLKKPEPVSEAKDYVKEVLAEPAK